MKKFEYKTELLSIVNEAAVSKRLNELGKEGWELIQVTYFPTSPRGLYIFKRNEERI